MKRVLALAALAGATALAVSGGSAQAGGAACPTSNRPNELVLAGGSGQTAQLGKPFPQNLQVELANTNGCPLTGNLAGVYVTFDAPGAGASGIFAGSGSHDALVGTNAQGVATAPEFTANYTAGDYTVDAHSDYGTVHLYLSNTANGLPSAITAIGTTSQEAAVNGPYAQPLQARVTDANGNPVQGATVTFSILPGPTGAGAAFLAGQAAVTTDANGIATSPPLLASGSPGRFTATASTAGVSGVAVYTLDNHAATTTLQPLAMSDPEATVGTQYRESLQARVLDATGQPIEGAPVTFGITAAANGPGATFLGGTVQVTALTDANGLAASPPLLANGSPGRFTATASTPGAPAIATYTLDNHAAALTLAAVRHSDPTATVGTRYPHRLAARVLDADRRPVEGATVTFAITAADDGAGATFLGGGAQATALTDADGLATSPALVANKTAGAFVATAVTTGARPAQFVLRNLAATPAGVAAGTASGEEATVGTRFPIPQAVTVTDENGNPVAGAVVTFTAPAKGPSGYFRLPRRHTTTGRRAKNAHARAPKTRARTSRIVRVRTNAKGIAVAPPFVANASPGGYAVTATVAGSSVQTAFSLLNLPRG